MRRRCNSGPRNTSTRFARSVQATSTRFALSVQNPKKNMEKWYVYIIKCKDKTFYTGITLDIKRRFQEHKEGRGGRYTRSAKVGQLVYYEECSKKGEALKREFQIKGWRREKKESLIRSRIPKICRRSSVVRAGPS